VADRFVRLRLVRITGVDLNLFDFDYDLTWAAFFMSADGKIYGRYGGRDARAAEERISLAGLRYALESALAAHMAEPHAKPGEASSPPVRVEDYSAAKRLHRNECIHCHQVFEFRRADQKTASTWHRDSRWIYPLPENIGVTLEVDRGNRVRSVLPKSLAERAGLRPGDTLVSLNHLPIASFADAQYALHRAPASGQIPVSWRHGDSTRSAQLNLESGWRKTNLTWRPSMLNILPALPLYGEDLSPVEKKALGLGDRRLAFRQDKTVHRDARAVGVEGGDIILGLDNQPLEMTMPEFLGYVRRNFLVGDRVSLNVLRAGKQLDLPMTLP
jgi:hypothetical protein